MALRSLFETVEADDRTHRAFQPRPLNATVAAHVGTPRQLIRQILIFLAAVHQREREQGVPSNVLEDQFTRGVPDLSSAKKESEALDQPGYEDRGTFAERPTEIHPEHASEGEYSCHDAHNTADLLDNNGGEGRSPVSTLTCANICQLQGMDARIRHLKRLLFPPMSRRK